MIEEARNLWTGQYHTPLEFSELTSELNALVFWLLSIGEEEAACLGGAEPSHPGDLVLERIIRQGTWTSRSQIPSHFGEAHLTLSFLKVSQTELIVHVGAAL